MAQVVLAEVVAFATSTSTSRTAPSFITMAAPRVLPLTPIEDQLLGALIMWIPGGIIFMIIMTVVFFKWNARGEDSTAGAQVDWKPSAA